MRQPGDRAHVCLLPATLFSPLCFPSLLSAQTEQPLRLLEPGGSGGSASSSGAPAPTTSAAPPLDLHDIHGPLPIEEPVNLLLYVLLAILLLGAVAGLWWWFRRRKQPAAPAIPPSTIARDELMRARDLMTAELQLQYMARVSDILRSYLEERFQLPTTRQTTREFFTTLAQGKAGYSELKRHRDELKSCLEQCDLAKYAHRSSTIENMQDMEASILRFVNRTEQPAAEPWQTAGEGAKP